ncbi:hypothetical protein ACFOG5_20665 [Pedobacter fastidiosus]|uniref:DUF3805 domain-containing protein n=1 Tax=Pedobacter fastidiosus TaxID=2765361 RepID=A0ABR7KU84_9SPHI|nr:hypothetical protein [Pedobacter fastidiosus]MBC6111595.1 hypothetical protein [Pedobacter fastidiosus]
MKKPTTFATILFLLCSFRTLAQIKIKTDMVEINLPKSVTKTNISQIPIVDNDGTITSIPKPAYDYEGLGLNLSYGRLMGDTRFLAESKEALDNRHNRYGHNNEYYFTEIKSNEKYIILISRDRGWDNNCYLFYLVNKNFTYQVSGTLDFLPAEEVKAKKQLDEILNSINITN